MKPLLIAAIVMSLSGSAWALDLQGHRGARGLAPENTLPGFATALSIGVSTLELDVNVTKDGHLVVGHDPVLQPHLARLDGKWIAAPGPVVWQTPLVELRRYDVGRLNPNTRYGQTYPEQKPVDGTRMPLLADVFGLAEKSGNRDVWFNIETKLNPAKPNESAPPTVFAAAVVEAIRKAGLASRSNIQSFDWRTLVEAAKLAPDIARASLTIEGGNFDTIQRGRPGPSPWLAGLDADDYATTPQLVKASGSTIWSPFWRNLTPELVREAHALGLKVIPWTVNDQADMAGLIDMKVDGIITDYPDRLRTVMQSRGLALPVPAPVQP